MLKKSLVYLTICTLLLAGLPLAAGATTVNTNVNITVSAVDQLGANGSVNWAEGVIEAVGSGVPSSLAKSPAQARLMARRAAIVDAQRNLLESIEGVNVTAESTLQNLELINDTVKTQISGIVKGARIVNEQQLFDGTYQVTMRINLFGKGSVAEVITEATRPVTPAPLPTPSPAYTPIVLPVYTGVVIDAAGLPLVRAMSPVVYDDTGRPIYGHVNIIPEFAVSQGMIDYLCTPEDISAFEHGQSRAGTTPIMAKAIGVRDNNINIIISQADADKILAANAQGNFLPKAMVCVKQ